ncbi:MAG: NUDIX domain-containing protein [Candidatus Woesearchaeota archaeon]
MDYEDLLKQARKKGINRLVVGAIIQNDSQVLFLQRSKNDFKGGLYELPSGKIELKESIKEALGREIKEETNLDLYEIIKYVDFFDYFSKNNYLTRQFNFIVKIQDFSNIILSEHENYIWLNKNELQNYNISTEVKLLIKNL